MVKGKITPDGDVTITFNMQTDKLYIDNGQRHLLPCEDCGDVVPVSLLTVSVICERCAICINCGQPKSAHGPSACGMRPCPPGDGRDSHVTDDTAA